MQLGLFTVVNPVLIGTALGAIWGGATINKGKLPDFLELLTSNLGNLVTPVAMLEIGVFLYHICLPVFRQALSKKAKPLSPEKVYYFIKNTIILNHRYFDRRKLRNVMAVAVALVRTARRNSPTAALSYLAGPRSPTLWKAIRRGLGGRIGKDFDA